MFGSNKEEQPLLDTRQATLIDPLTIWLIRIACIFIISLFFVILLGLPVVISLGKTQIDNLILNSKEFLRGFLALYLVK
tara:strand:+ start:7958 stop:8194 length:237 start_codon:yes stop_codon:yes gene_type:complete